MRRLAIVAVLAALSVGAFPGVAAAQDDLIIEVSGPRNAAAGEDLDITVTVRRASDGAPAEGVPLEFFTSAFFAGVTGDIRLGSTVTNSIGVATFNTTFTVRGVHRVRVEVAGEPDIEPGTVTIGIGIGEQIIESEVGIAIPGLGAWVVTTVIGAVWVIMIVAALWMVRVSRSGREEEEPGDKPRRWRRRARGFSLAPWSAGALILLALGLVTVLLRSPDTHHNFDPEGYVRSPVAYLDAAYFYPGVGLVDGALSGDAVADGRSLFLSLGCAGCHGLNAQGAAAAASPAFATRPWLETVMRTGLPGGMPPYPESDVPSDQVDLLHAFLVDARDALAGEAPLPGPTTTTTTSAAPTTTAAAAAPTFAEVMQVLQPNCGACHGNLGGWSAADYDSVVNSGNNGPAVIPGDPEGSVLAQKMLGTHTFGSIMPPGGALPDADVQLIVDWIAGGAPQ